MRNFGTYVFYGRELELKGVTYKYAVGKEITGNKCSFYVAFRKGNAKYNKYHRIGGLHDTFDSAYKAMICEEYDLIMEEWDYEADLLDKE